jgi:hypothetical protein
MPNIGTEDGKKKGAVKGYRAVLFASGGASRSIGLDIAGSGRLTLCCTTT